MNKFGEMKTLTTKQAVLYLSEQLNKPGKPYHVNQLHRWRLAGIIKRHTMGTEGNQTTYTLDALNRLVAIIKARRNST